MSGHLSSQRISLWMLGERTPEDLRHVAECPECAAEVARFETTLGQFRGAVHGWADRQGGSAAGRVLTARPVSHGLYYRPLRWAVVATVLLLAAAVPVYRSARHPQPGASMAQADAQLLEEVDAGVSRTVPQPMEPLLKLVAWDSSNQTDATGKENDETTQQK